MNFPINATDTGQWLSPYPLTLCVYSCTFNFRVRARRSDVSFFASVQPDAVLPPSRHLRFSMLRLSFLFLSFFPVSIRGAREQSNEVKVLRVRVPVCSRMCCIYVCVCTYATINVKDANALVKSMNISANQMHVTRVRALPRRRRRQLGLLFVWLCVSICQLYVHVARISPHECLRE